MITSFCNNINYQSFKKFNKSIQDIFYKYALKSKDKYKTDISNSYLYKSTSIIRFYNLLYKPFRKFLPIKVLTHVSNINSLDNILKYGILTREELKKLNIEYKGYASMYVEEEDESENQFIGSYVSPIIDTSPKYIKEIFGYDTNSNIMLLIDPYILNRDDWHINSKDTNGYLSNETFTKDTLNLYLKSKKDLPEIVFHNKIQSEFIRGIMIDKKNEKIVKNILKKYKYKINIYFTYNIKNVNVYNDSMINTYKDIIGNSNYYPRFCMSFYISEHFDSKISIENYIKLALNCGMSEDDIIKFLEQCKKDKTSKENCIKQLLDVIGNKYEHLNIENNKYLYPVYEPPFTKPISNDKIIKLLNSLKSLYN